MSQFLIGFLFATAAATPMATSSMGLVRRAMQSNLTVAAAQLDVRRAEARLRQAMLYPNPSLDFEATTGRFTGAEGEGGSVAGIAFPLELGGKRAARIEVARAELNAARARFRERQRQVASEVLSAYAETLASRRELEMLERLNELDIDTANFVEARVREGDAPPLERRLLEVEIDRLRARRTLLEGRFGAALVRLKTLAGIPPGEEFRVAENLDSASVPAAMPVSLDAAIAAAIARRPDVQLARANEQAAAANLRFARAQAIPDVTPFGRYAIERSVFDRTPVGPITDRDRLFSFGVSVTLPFFNRNQGARAEAVAAVEQAKKEREFAEATVRAEVESAYIRLRSAEAARKTFEAGVIVRSNENIQTIRAAYQLGEFRITDLIAEQRRLVDSQRDYTELLTERYKALADLAVAIGRFETGEEQ